MPQKLKEAGRRIALNRPRSSWPSFEKQQATIMILVTGTYATDNYKDDGTSSTCKIHDGNECDDQEIFEGQSHPGL